MMLHNDRCECCASAQRTSDKLRADIAELRNEIETAYVELASLARWPTDDDPDWSPRPSVFNRAADMMALDRAFKALRRARNVHRETGE